MMMAAGTSAGPRVLQLIPNKEGYAEAAELGYMIGLSNQLVIQRLDPIFMSNTSLAEVSDLLKSLNCADENNPVYVLGGYSTSNVKEEMAVTNSLGCLYMNAGGATESIYESPISNSNGLGFGLLSGVRNLTETILDYMMQKMDTGALVKPSNVVLIWESGDHGDMFRRTAISYALKYPAYFHISYLGGFEYDPKQSLANFDKLVTDISMLNRRMNIEQNQQLHSLLVDAHSADFKRLHNEISESSLSFEFISYGARGGDPADVTELTRPLSAGNLSYAAWWDPAMNTTSNREFMRLWRSRAGYSWAEESSSNDNLFQDPSNQIGLSWFGSLAAEAASILVKAASVDHRLSSMKAYLLSETFVPTIIPGGKIEFNRNGQVHNSMLLNQAVIKGVSPYRVVSKTLFPSAEASGEFGLWKYGSQNATSTCTSENFRLVVTPCGLEGYRNVEVLFLDSLGILCPDPGVNCSCTVDRRSSLIGHRVGCKYVPVASNAGTVIIVLSVLGIAFCYALWVALFYNFSHPIMKAGQREFLSLMCFAGVWACFAALSFVGPITDTMCRTRISSVLFSVTILLGALTVKVYRIYRIWNNSSMKRIVISARQMFILLGIMVAIDIVLILCWFTIDIPKSVDLQYNYTVGGSATVEYFETECQYSESSVFPVLAVSYVGIILIACNMLSMSGRKSDNKYMESNSILAASYCTSFIFIIVIVVVAITDVDTASQYTLIALGLILSAVFFISFVLGSKLFLIYKDRSQEMNMEAIPSLFKSIKSLFSKKEKEIVDNGASLLAENTEGTRASFAIA